MTLCNRVHCSAIASPGHTNHVATLHLWTKNDISLRQFLTPALLVPVLSPVLRGNHLPLQDAPAHHRLPHLVSGGRVILVSHHLDTLL